MSFLIINEYAIIITMIKHKYKLTLEENAVTFGGNKR